MTSRTECAIATLLVSAVSLAAMWPVPLHVGSVIGAHVDALFGAWRLAWIADSLSSAPAALFHPPIFYPHRWTLAYSDSILLSGALAAPLRWSGVSPLAAYNTFVMFSVLASGLAAMTLGKVITGSWLAGALAGIIYTVNPHRMEHLERLELLTTAAVPLLFVLWHQAVRRNSSGFALMAGAAVAVQWYTGMYIGLFLACIAPLVLLDLIWTTRADRGRLAAGFVAGGVLAAALVAPSVWPYLQARQQLGERQPEEIIAYSATIENFAAVHPRNALYANWLAANGAPERHLFPGVTAIVLAVVGLCASSGRTRAVYGAVAVVAVMLTLGLNTPVFAWLREWFLPFRAIRAPVRAANLVMLAVSVFAAAGAMVLFRRATTALATTLAVILGLVLFAEYRMRPSVWTLRPGVHDSLAILGVPPDAVLLELPVAQPERLDLSVDAHYMFDRIGEWPLLVNGSSGHYPPAYIALLEQLRTFPDARSFMAVVAYGVTHLTVHEKWLEARYPATMNALLRRNDISIVGVYREDGGEVAVFALQAAR